MSLRFHCRTVVVLLVCAWPVSFSAGQTIWYVDDDAVSDPGPGDSTISDPMEDGTAGHPFDAIQEAINAATPGASPADEILVADGTYAGLGNRDLDFGGKIIKLRSANGSANCIIDCEGNGRGFFFHSNETADAVIDGLTIQNGWVETTDPGGANGGGVYCLDSNPTLVHCVISGNTASGSYAGGGGVCCKRGGPTLVGCTVVGNSALTASDAWGGGVGCWDADAVLIDCTISGNSVGGGPIAYSGGVHCYECSPTLIRCTIAGNSASGGNLSGYADGGGVGCWSSQATLINCSINGNTVSGYSAEGGGLHCSGSSPTLSNCTVTDNRAGDGAGMGGGMFCFFSSPTLTNCTLSGNSATWWGGGAYCTNESNPTLSNCVLWGNTPAEIYAQSSSCPALTFCDVLGGTGQSWFGDGCIESDPLFADPDGPDNDPNLWQDNDYRLSAGSPCIDAGDDTAVPADSADLDGDGNTSERAPRDLDGFRRFVDDLNTTDTGYDDPPAYPEVVDMGAYEYADCNLNGVQDGLELDPVLPALSPIGYWALDEGSGTTASDSSGHGHPGTVSGAAWAPGISGTALEVVDHDIVKNISPSVDDPIVATDAMTLSCWVNWYGPHPNTYSVNSYIFDARKVWSGGFICFIRPDGRPRFFLIAGDGAIHAVDGYAAIPIGAWTHVAAVYEGATQHLRLCINGIPVGVAAAPREYSDTSLTVAIGNNRWAPGDNQWAPLNGVVDEVRLYDQALSAVEILQMISRDCNENGMPDECEPDENQNGIPDGCEADCNENGVLDDLDIASQYSDDLNGNGVPDECEPDCNENGLPDVWDVMQGTSLDCNSNGIPDDCEIAGGTSPDCQPNGIPDECDIAQGTSADSNSNGVPDECEEQHLGDLNCDNLVNYDDIQPFVLALTAPATYEAAYPDCELANGDLNESGTIDGRDIQLFVNLLLTP